MHSNYKLPYLKKNSVKGYCYLLILIVLFFFQLKVLGQNDHAKFKRLSTNEGLSQGHVSAILKDTRGFMWFATDEGINRYDGYRFTIYKHDPEKASSLINNFAYDIVEDKTGNLWVGTATGLDKYDRWADSFTHYNPGIAGTISIKDIFQDSKSRIWVGTLDGLYLFDAVTKIFTGYRHNTKSNSISNNVIYSITEDNEGKLWIATKDGLNTLEPETGKFTCYKNGAAKTSIGANWIKSVYKDSKGNIWAGTQGSGIALFNPADNSFTNFLHSDTNPTSISHNDILCFAEDKNGNLWVGTENGGISVFDFKTRCFSHYQSNIFDNSSLSNNSIYCIYKDDINNMWVGTWSGGINYLPFYGEKFMVYRQVPGNENSLSSNIILSIAGDSDGIIWIGTDGGGLNRFDQKLQTFTHFRHNKNNINSISSDYVLSVIEVEPGILLIGYHRGGFDLFNTKTGVFVHHLITPGNANNLPVLSVNIVCKDRRGLLWLGTWGGGLDVFNPKTNSFLHYRNNPADTTSIDNNFINVISEDAMGNIWVGTDLGLNLLDTKTNRFIHYTNNPLNKQSISHNMVESMLKDKTGNIWIATGGGLNLFDLKTNAFKAYTEKDGLSGNMIHDMLEDSQGNLWISSNQGISKFNIQTKAFRNYGVADGLQGNDFKSRCAYKSADGQLFFGGPNGLNVFYPERIRDNDFVPPVYITGFQLFNKQVLIGSADNHILDQHIIETKEITLSYKQSVFTFEFSALNFTSPERNQYAYKLEGFDKEWTYVGNKRTATYTNLDAGEYFFNVTGSNNDGIWNKTATSVRIIVTPPFWLTWWFRILAFVSITGGAVAYYKYRINVIKAQKIKLQQQVHEKTRLLIQSTNEEQRAREAAEKANIELERKNIELEQFAYIASHDLQEPLRTTSSFVKLIQNKYQGKMDEKADQYFAFILDASDRMKILISNLLEYSRIGNKKEKEQVDCNTIIGQVLADLSIAITEARAHITYTALPVISGYPTEIKQLFQNLVTNAIKFRKAGTLPEVKISAKKLQDSWQFSFADNGIGIEKKYMDKIFIIFQRLHTRTEYEGSGIGLAHCKKIVELHDGKIWIDSVTGEGSTFHFTIRAGKENIQQAAA